MGCSLKADWGGGEGRKAFQMGKWTSNGWVLGGERSARLKQVDMMGRSWRKRKIG